MDVIFKDLLILNANCASDAIERCYPAAHLIYGASETINRAYLRIFEVIEKCRALRPAMVPYILNNLTQIHKGQDISLVWRQTGYPLFTDQETALDTYRQYANLKTGALFRLVDKLVTEIAEKDQLLSRFGWYCRLQNDCKNVYSYDVITAKGTLAEDLVNSEYSFLIVTAIYSSLPGRGIVQRAIERQKQLASGMENELLKPALALIQCQEIKELCMSEMERTKLEAPQFASIWGRHEKMSLK